METRLERLDQKDARVLSELVNHINRATQNKKDSIFLEIALLMRKADAYQPEFTSYSSVTFEYQIYKSVWTEAEKMRSSGELLMHAGRLNCPVLAIHGDYYPHPFAGVKSPLEKEI